MVLTLTNNLRKALIRLSLLGIISTPYYLYAAEPVIEEPVVEDSDTQQYYDPISGKMLSADQVILKTSNELLFEVKVDKTSLGEIITLQVNDILLVDFQELIELLDFPIDYKVTSTESEKDGPNISASGWFINPKNSFTITTITADGSKTYTVTHQDKEEQLSPLSFTKINNQLYLPLEQALSWFNISFTALQSDLQITLHPSEELPIQAKLKRKNRDASSFANDFSLEYPRRDTPYQLISPSFTDAQFNINKTYTNDYKFNLSLFGAGDLAYMTGNYYFGYNYNDVSKRSITNMSLSLTKNDVDSSLLGPLKASHVSLGDIGATPLTNIPSSGAGLGIRLSNRPYGQITNATSTNITGIHQASWDVELYYNNIFVGTQTIGDDGQYEFLDQPLSVGENIFTLKFFGPQGQRDEDRRVYNVNKESLSGNKIVYDFSINKQNTQFSDFFRDTPTQDEDRYNINLHLEKGITQQFSVSSDFSQTYFRDGSRQLFIQPGVRLFAGGTLYSLNYLTGTDNGHLASIGISKGIGKNNAHKVNLGLSQTSKDFRLSSSSATSTSSEGQSLSVQGPLHNSLLPLKYQVVASFSQTSDKSSYEAYKLNLSTALARFRLSNNLNYSQSHSPGIQTSPVMNGSLQLATHLGRVSVRSAFNYLVKPETKMSNGSLNLQWSITNALTADTNYTHNFIGDTNSKSISLNWKHKYFSTSFYLYEAAGNTTASLIFKLGMAHDPLKNEFLLSQNRLSNTSAVSALVFEDLNNNQQYDDNEPLIENAEIVAVQQRKRAKTDETGTTFLTGLHDGSPTDIEVNIESLEDPFWVPSKKGFSFLPRPGLIKIVMIPIVSAGEIEGTVTYSNNLFGSAQEQGRVPLVLTNTVNGEIIETYSAFDGFFLFNTVPPGNYILQVDKKFLDKKNIETRPPFPITIGHKGSLIMGANFELYTKGKYDFSTEITETGIAYNIDLGQFLSEENAKTVLGALRSVFPSVLANLKNNSTYEMHLIKKQNEQYQLLLGPLFNLNHVKYICGSLAKENLHCQPIKAVVKPNFKGNDLPALNLKSDLNVEKNKVAETLSSTPKIASTLITPRTDTVKQTSNKNYTLQLMSTLSASGLEGYIEENGLLDTDIITLTDKSGNTKHLLTMGNYTDRGDAEQMAAQLKHHLGIKPWIRTFESIYTK